MRIPNSVSIVLVCALALSACGHKGAGQQGRALSGPQHALNAGGEPLWSAQVRDGVLQFAAGEAQPFTAQTTFADHGQAGLVWTGALPPVQGRPGGAVRLTAVPKPCGDADTGMTYPMAAVLEVPGGRYGGCAALPGQGLGPRR